MVTMLLEGFDALAMFGGNLHFQAVAHDVFERSSSTKSLEGTTHDMIELAHVSVSHEN